MNGKTDIDEILNPCSSYIDKNTWGWTWLNICFHGHRLMMLHVGRLTVDIYLHCGRLFTAMGGGAPGIDRYWMLFGPFGKIQWVTRRANAGMSRLSAPSPGYETQNEEDTP